MHLHLHHEAKQWPYADHFLDALPAPHDISSPFSFDESVVPGPKSVLSSLSADSIICLCQLYSRLCPPYEEQLHEGQASISSTFRKYSGITWQGKNLTTTLNKNAKNPFVFVVPPFPFTTSFATDKEERLAEIDFFLMHSVVLPNTQEPKSSMCQVACGPP